MGDSNPAAGGVGRDKQTQTFLYFFFSSSNLLPRVGRGFGKIFKAIQLPGSEQYLRGPPRGSRLARLHVFAGGAHGCGPKSYQITSWELTWNSS